MYKINGLTGASRIVFEDLCRLLRTGEPVSIEILADESGYSRATVMRALSRLRHEGLIETYQPVIGTRAEYKIKENDGMGNINSVIKSLIGVVTMSSNERARRLMNAFVSKGVYDDGHKLQRLASMVGGDFNESVNEWLEENGILKVMTVWDMDEALLVKDQINDLIAQAKERLE